ncbi:arginine--tRNA ligase, partial [archaeon]|nr:arginine--tRNA ligase [archaeon]
MDFEKEIINILKKEVKGTITLETPQNKEFGDYSFPCFSLAKEYKKNPVEIAKDLVKKLKITKSIKEIKNIGGYVNFFVDKSSNTKNILEEILKKKDKYGMTDIGKNKKALIEHTSINPNASPHVGRARNAIIGDSITRILKFSNYKVEVHYFVNDVGKQIALLVLGCKSKTKFDNLLKIYIKMNKKLEKDPKLEKKVFELLQKLEKGNKKVKDKFKRTVNICIKGQTKLFSELGINYDYFDYESKYLWSKEVTKILNKLKKTKKVFVDEHKRNVLDQSKFKLAMKSPVLVLTRSDGTSLYPLRDITYNLDKIKKADKNIVVLGEDHKLYFLQLKAALSLLKIKAPEVIHYSFILLKKGKMSTRKGNLVMLEDFMKECREKAKKEIIKRHG